MTYENESRRFPCLCASQASSDLIRSTSFCLGIILVLYNILVYYHIIGVLGG